MSGKDQYDGILLKVGESRNTTLTSKEDIVPKSYDETTVSHASELIIKDEYASLVPPEEYQSIRQSMEDDGQWVPIIVNAQRIILDGYTRFRACKEIQIVEGPLQEPHPI